MQENRLQQLLSPFRVCILLLAIFFAPLCGWLFQCGCTYLWSGASAHCSIHDPARADCPWCVMPFKKAGPRVGVVLQTLPFFLISFILFGLSKLQTRYFDKNYWPQFLILLGEMLVITTAVAWIYAMLLHYPVFRF